MVANMATHGFVWIGGLVVLAACGGSVLVDETQSSREAPDCASAYPCTEMGRCQDNGLCNCFGVEDCWLGEPGASEHVGYGACCTATSDDDCQHSELCMAKGEVCYYCGDGTCGVEGCGR
jgi:hypothetical protein